MSLKHVRLEFELKTGIMEPTQLPCLGTCIIKALPVTEYGSALIGISGRMPVWAYAYITHLLHPYSGVATYEPRQNAFVVVARHSPQVPREGSVVEANKFEEKIVIEV